ncbi:MAG: hypothetical protein ACOC9Y_05430 [Chloroflexota bacterium]
MNLQPKSGTWESDSGDLSDNSPITMDGDTSVEQILLFDADWVDPDTLEPFEESAEAQVEERIRGATRVVVRKWLPGSPYPETAWSRTLRSARNADEAESVSGMSVADAPSGDGVVYSVSGLSVNLDGAVAVSIGLEPAASGANQINWGELEITSVPTIELSEALSITTAETGAQLLNGVLKNERTGEQIRFRDVFSDDGGLEIDVSAQASIAVVQGADGVGPVYGFPEPSNGVRWFDLRVGENAWSTSGDLADIEFEWPTRIMVGT